MTRVEFTPVSGRTHQLRNHSQQFGHSILGCDLYGGVGALEINRANTLISDTLIPDAHAERLMLHATRLAFLHPITGEAIDWLCDAPF